jgi:tetratricopeptide (TPR) repeat protein
LEGKIGLLGKLLSMSEKEYHEWQLENEPSAPLALAMLPPPPPETAGAVGKPIADVLGTVDARYRLAVLKQTRALDRDRLMTATEDPKQQAELRAEAAKLYAEAANLFAGIAADLAPVVREQAGGANQQQILETYLLARAQTGWTHFYIGQLFSRDPKDKAKMTNEYAEAQDAFESFLRDYPNYLISLWIQCGLGMAYRSLGETEKAGDLFRRVVMRRRGQDVNPIRYQAYFWVVETYRLATRYDDAIRMANRFIAEIGEKSDSPIAQAIKLEKAEAYADEAEQYRRADRLAEARAGYMKAVAIMDILIREGGQNTAEAQKLLEQWRRALLDMD